MKISKVCLAVITAVILFAGCKKPAQTTINTHPHLIFKFVFDSTQVRLNSLGQPDSTFPVNHAGQNPQMNVMSGHYIELAPTAYTALGAGTVLYMTPTTTAGGSSAIDFSKEVLTPDGGTFYSVALDSVTPGTYEYLRVSLAYQNYSVKMYVDTTISTVVGGTTYTGTINEELPCTVASFVGVNTYITSYKVNTESITVNGNRAQGYWGFESAGTLNYTMGNQSYPYPYNYLNSGQADSGATTVVNPLFATSPIPSGSCVATGQFVTGSKTGPLSSLTVTGHETQDIVITVSLSINHSFEWQEVVNDGKWQPSIGENIVDMGIRGLIPIIGQ